MKIYKPYPGKGVQYGILFLLSLLVIMGVTISKVFEASKSLFSILPIAIIMVFLIGLFSYFIFVAKSLSYILEDHFLIIKWGFSQKKVDLNEIGNIEKRLGITAFKVAGAGWPGLHIGSYSLGSSNVNLYATRLIGDIIIFKHKWETIGITPENPEEFLEDLSKIIPHIEAKVIDPKKIAAAKQEEENKNTKIIKVLSGVNLVFLAATFLWVKIIISNLPARIPLHVGVNGIDRYGSPNELFLMPFISTVVFIIMFLLTRFYRGSKSSIYMLLGSAIITTLLINLALLSIISL